MFAVSRTELPENTRSEFIRSAFSITQQWTTSFGELAIRSRLGTAINNLCWANSIRVLFMLSVWFPSLSRLSVLFHLQHLQQSWLGGRISMSLFAVSWDYTGWWLAGDEGRRWGVRRHTHDCFAFFAPILDSHCAAVNHQSAFRVLYVDEHPLTLFNQEKALAAVEFLDLARLTDFSWAVLRSGVGDHGDVWEMGLDLDFAVCKKHVAALEEVHVQRFSRLK